MFLNDILQVIYAPKKAFKSIIANPKYLGAILILILFVGIQVGYEYVQFSKTYTEQVSPTIDQLYTYTNASLWTTNQGTTVTNNNDHFNYTIYLAGYGFYSNLFGNTSLQIQAADTNNLTASLSDAFNVDCSETGFQNLSLTLKPVEPLTTLQNATLTLYSLTDTDFFQYDLTQTLSTLTANEWNNLTIPIGKTAVDWTPSGNPTWSNITET